MAVTVEVEHPLPGRVPSPANGLNLRIAWRPVNGHGGGGCRLERMPLAPGQPDGQRPDGRPNNEVTADFREPWLTVADPFADRCLGHVEDTAGEDDARPAPRRRAPLGP
jgi:hypothetical protein